MYCVVTRSQIKCSDQLDGWMCLSVWQVNDEQLQRQLDMISHVIKAQEEHAEEVSIHLWHDDIFRTPCSSCFPPN